MLNKLKKFLNDAVDTRDYEKEKNVIKHQVIRSNIETAERAKIDASKIKNIRR